MLDGSAGVQTLDHVNVQDSDADGGAQLVCLSGQTGVGEGCEDGGNTSNWFYGDSISGTVYTDNGVTNIGVGKLVSASVNGGAVGATDLTDSSGAFTIEGLTTTGGSILTLYLDGESQNAVTVVLASGNAMTNIDLYQNRLIVRSESGAAVVSGSTLKVAADSGDSDISAIYSVKNSDDAVVLADGTTFHVWLPTEGRR